MAIDQNQLYKNASDEKLMQLQIAGDQRAFEVLYDRYAYSMLRFFLRMLGQDREKAQDFLQDLFVKVVDKSHLYRQESRLRTWLYTIAANMCKNEYRRQNVRRIIIREQQPDQVFVAETADVATSLDHERFRRRLLQVLATLGPSQQMTFLLRYQEGMSISEISDILNIAVGTAKSRLHNINRQLAAKCSEFAPEIERIKNDQE